MGKDVIVALDFPTGKEALDFLDLFQKEERKPYVKPLSKGRDGAFL